MVETTVEDEKTLYIPARPGLFGLRYKPACSPLPAPFFLLVYYWKKIGRCGTCGTAVVSRRLLRYFDVVISQALTRLLIRPPPPPPPPGLTLHQ